MPSTPLPRRLSLPDTSEWEEIHRHPVFNERDDSTVLTVAHPAVEDRTPHLYVDCLTHPRRLDLPAFALEPTRDPSWWAGHFALPQGLHSGMGFLLLDAPFTRAAVTDRTAWQTALCTTTPLCDAWEVTHYRATAPRGTLNPVALRGARPAPCHDARRGQPPVTPRSTPHTFHSRALGINVEVRVRLPRSRPEFVLLASDGGELTHNTPLIPHLDVAEAEGRAPATAVVLFSQVNTGERAVLLGANPRFPEFLEHELIPWARHAARQRGTVLPASPHRTIVAGSSLGGLAAAETVRTAPGVVAKAIIQSAALWYPDHSYSSIRAWESTPCGPLGIYHAVGEYDVHLREENIRFADMLTAREGVRVKRLVYRGGHDYACWRAGIIDALSWFGTDI